MTRLPDDPEVLADLRAREAAGSDPTRARRARNPWADAATVEHVEHWPCSKGCGVMVGITQEAVTALAVMNARLVTTGQRPIDKARAIPCADCKRIDDELASQQRGTRAPASAQPQRRHEQTQIAVLDDYRPSGMRSAKGRR